MACASTVGVVIRKGIQKVVATAKKTELRGKTRKKRLEHENLLNFQLTGRTYNNSAICYNFDSMA